MIKVQPRFKKGDKAFWVSISASNGSASVYAQSVTIQSWGRKQATATLDNSGGRNAFRRIYPDYHFVFSTREEVIAHAAERAPGYAEENRLREIHCLEDNFPRGAHRRPYDP